MTSDPQSFVRRCLDNKLRLDSRLNFDARPISIIYNTKRNHTEVCLGDTKYLILSLLNIHFLSRVIASVLGHVVHPQPQRPSDGEIHVKLHITPMSSPDVDSDKFSFEHLNSQQLYLFLLQAPSEICSDFQNC